MTSDQETRVLAMLAAFEAGKKISDLDTASGSVSDMRIEVLDNVDLTDAVTGAYVPMLDRIIEQSQEMAANADEITRQATAAINACTAITEKATAQELSLIHI